MSQAIHKTEPVWNSVAERLKSQCLLFPKVMAELLALAALFAGLGGGLVGLALLLS